MLFLIIVNLLLSLLQLAMTLPLDALVQGQRHT